MQKIVVALGGNALQSGNGPATAEAQLEVVKKTCEHIAEISGRGYEVAVVHGNGPQVGRILLASETAKDVTPAMPFDVCGAMSQGYIGYHLQQALRFALKKRDRNVPVVTLATQVVVDENDPGFKNPTKPIGPFYSEEEAKAMVVEKGYSVKEDAGRGWRRVVASPIPKKIVEIDSVRKLWDTTIVITCGGGGIPVLKQANRLKGASAVIEKDLASGKLAELLDADVLLLLTGEKKLYLNYGKDNCEPLDTISVDKARSYIAEGQFAETSILPKVVAAVSFVSGKPGRVTVIADLDDAKAALEEKAGTIIK